MGDCIKTSKKLPNFYKTRENALIYFLQGEEKRQVAKEALPRLAWSVRHVLSALAETENDRSYLDRAAQIEQLLKQTDNLWKQVRFFDNIIKKSV